MHTSLWITTGIPDEPSEPRQAEDPQNIEYIFEYISIENYFDNHG